MKKKTVLYISSAVLLQMAITIISIIIDLHNKINGQSNQVIGFGYTIEHMAWTRLFIKDYFLHAHHHTFNTCTVTWYKDKIIKLSGFARIFIAS